MLGVVATLKVEPGVRRPVLALVVAVLLASTAGAELAIQAFPLPRGGGFPHDVAVDAQGIARYTAQRSGQLGRLDPATGKVELVSLGKASSPARPG